MNEMMKDFLTEERLVRTDIRVEKTLESMGALARALSGYSGRKNLLWLSEAFPASVLPRRDDIRPTFRNYLAVFQKYISVYPIDLRGLMNTGIQPTGAGQSWTLRDGKRQN